MHHHFGFIVCLSVCGETPCCVGGGQSFLAVYLLHAWTVWKLCVGQTPRRGRFMELLSAVYATAASPHAECSGSAPLSVWAAFFIYGPNKSLHGLFYLHHGQTELGLEKKSLFETCFQLCCCSLLLQMTLNPMIIFCPVLNGFCVSTKTKHVTGFPENKQVLSEGKHLLMKI